MLPNALRTLSATVAVTCATLAAPTAATAADFWVDDGGNDILNGCAFPTNPCDTIDHTIDQAVANADATDTIHVGGGSYPEAFSLPPGVSLLKDNWVPFVFSTAGPATIDGAADPAITVPQGLPTRSISGNFILRGNDDGTPGEGSVYVAFGADPGNVTISGATFNELGAGMGIPVQLQIDGGSPKVLGSTFTGVDQNQTYRAINYSGEGSPEFGGNTMTTFFIGIGVADTAAAGFPIVNAHDNVITEVYETAAIPAGIQLIDTSGQITGNTVRGKAGQTLGSGVSVTSAGTGGTVSFAGNQIYDIPAGINISGGDPVSFSSDLIANTGVGLSIFSNPGGVTASGLTVTHSNNPVNREIYVDNTALTLDSSIVGDQGVELAGTATCTSAFSRGPAAPGNCGFATVADPAYADPASDDFHILTGSPMVEMGNPAPPPPGTTDIDGAARAVDTILDCLPVPRRDIGADEFAAGAGLLDCIAPDTTVSGKAKVKSRKKRARVSFTLVSEPGATFECKLDSGPFVPCTSPFTARLRRGAHTLAARAADASGNVDTSPAEFKVKVKKKKRKKRKK